ncbi:hypothetical protein G647_01797 [Cladophialophora carrionii CBS 160.54]|uniref:Uncharacterized protein n=1 Tax=Cladophialophora carrionii CBS 160.54 TaxID=1279043 RepID=V9DR15_9EURO|nr:uncharacterized protein G647_01797 [Cladophialophora carrionii CBS 160.54]ETI29344.1 hypothetical protein G647_01797 [Cladophialophora carrionii CBS 160.54]
MCYTFVTRPYCPCCCEFVKNVSEEEIKEQICPLHAPCKVRLQRPLPRSPRVEVVKTVCADCSWKNARELFAFSTAADRLGTADSNLCSNTKASLPEKESILRNPISANGSYVGLQADENTPDTLAVEDDADFESRGASYVGTELMRELGEQKEQPTNPAENHSSAPSVAHSSSPNLNQASCHCCSLPQASSARIEFIPMGTGMPGAPTMPKADRMKAAAAAARAASRPHPGAPGFTPGSKASPSPPKTAVPRRPSRPYSTVTPPRPPPHRRHQRQNTLPTTPRWC